MEYKRLTTKDEEGNWTIWEDDYSHPFEALQVAIERLAELEDKIERGELISVKTIAKLMERILDAPCNYELDGQDVVEYMCDNLGNWCEENCKNRDYEMCWVMYLKAKLKELQNG